MSDPYFDKVVWLHPCESNTSYARVDNGTLKFGGTAGLSLLNSHNGSSAIKFNNTGTYAQSNYAYLNGIDTSKFIFTRDFTVEFWLYSYSYGASWGEFLMVTTDASATSGTGFIINQSQTNHYLQISLNGVSCICTSALSTGTWHHVAVTRTNGLIQIWQDGVAHANTCTTTAQVGCTRLIMGQSHNNAGTTGISGFIDDIRITKDVARYSSTFTPESTYFKNISGIVKDDTDTPASRIVRAYPRITGKLIAESYTGEGDPYWENVVLRMTMDGSDGGTTFTDVIGASFTRTGNCTTETDQYKFGGSSAYFDGSFTKLVSTLPSAIGVEDVTVELWYHPTAIDLQVLVDFRTGDNTTGFAIDLGNSVSGKIDLWTGGAARVVGTTTLTTGAWYHIAAVRASGQLKLYINGTQEGSAYADSSNYSSTTLTIGNYIGSGDATANMQGYIDDLRITKGYARYTTTFTPPTSALPIKLGNLPANIGNFSFIVPDTEHTIICLDDDDGTEYNALIYDKVMPV